MLIRHLFECEATGARPENSQREEDHEHIRDDKSTRGKCAIISAMRVYLFPISSSACANVVSGATGSKPVLLSS